MEYEIEEEHALFDESNNPSLERSPRPAGRASDRRTVRKAELIPEEATAA